MREICAPLQASFAWEQHDARRSCLLATARSARTRREKAGVVCDVEVRVGLLVPIYFVTSGMTVDIPGLRRGDLAALGLILAVACAGKFLGAFGGARVAGMNMRNAAAIGVLMNTRGVIEIVLLTVGRDRGLIDDRLFTLLALMAILTTLLTSPLLRIIAPVARERLNARRR